MAIGKFLAALTSLPLCITILWGNAVAQDPTSLHEHATSVTQSTPTPMMNVTAPSFATQAAVIGKAEVALGELALERSKNSEVRAYAQRMIKDHTAANDSLQKLAVRENITLPNSLDSRHEAVRQKLASLHGEEFDRQYEREMAKGHDAAVTLFQSATQSPQMPHEFKEFAATTLSTLEDHREQAQQLIDKNGT